MDNRHIDNLSLAERIFLEVKESIIIGDYAGGLLISEGEIAQRFQSSRTPVREALIKLESEGWVKLFPKKGALIVPIIAGEAYDVLAARHIIESGAVAVMSPGAEHIVLLGKLEEIIQQQEYVADNAQIFSEKDVEFHTAIVEYTQNPYLLNTYLSLRERQRRMTNRVARKTTTEQMIIGHKKLLEHIHHCDYQAFNAELTHHMFESHQIDVARGQRPRVAL